MSEKFEHSMSNADVYEIHWTYVISGTAKK